MDNFFIVIGILIWALLVGYFINKIINKKDKEELKKLDDIEKRHPICKDINLKGKKDETILVLSKQNHDFALTLEVEKANDETIQKYQEMLDNGEFSDDQGFIVESYISQWKQHKPKIRLVVSND